MRKILLAARTGIQVGLDEHPVPDSLLANQKGALEQILWSAARTFGERAGRLRRLGKRKYHSETVGKHWGATAKDMKQ